MYMVWIRRKIEERLNLIVFGKLQNLVEYEIKLIYSIVPKNWPLTTNRPPFIMVNDKYTIFTQVLHSGCVLYCKSWIIRKLFIFVNGEYLRINLTHWRFTKLKAYEKKNLTLRLQGWTVFILLDDSFSSRLRFLDKMKQICSLTHKWQTVHIWPQGLMLKCGFRNFVKFDQTVD